MPRPASLDWSWAERTGGRLTARQKREVVQAMLPTILRYPAIRVALARRRGTRRLDLDALRWPDSALAREAEAHAREVLEPWVLEHSYRTWLFGLILAQADGAEHDDELVFVASVLHDLALGRAADRCFAVSGGEEAGAWAASQGAPPERASALAAAVAGHITPGAADDLTDPAGFVSAGAFADITGVGLQDADPRWVDDVHRRHPRHGLRRRLPEVWKAEGRALPDGRAALLTKTGFPALIHLSPFGD